MLFFLRCQLAYFYGIACYVALIYPSSIARLYVRNCKRQRLVTLPRNIHRKGGHDKQLFMHSPAGVCYNCIGRVTQPKPNNLTKAKCINHLNAAGIVWSWMGILFLFPINASPIIPGLVQVISAARKICFNCLIKSCHCCNANVADLFCYLFHIPISFSFHNIAFISLHQFCSVPSKLRYSQVVSSRRMMMLACALFSAINNLVHDLFHIARQDDIAGYQNQFTSIPSATAFFAQPKNIRSDVVLLFQ